MDKTEQVLFILPGEIIEEIMSRLPVQPLLKFTRVSKRWRSIIGSKRFIKSHLQNSKNNVHHLDVSEFRLEKSLFKYEMLRINTTPPPPSDHYRDSLRIVGSCNGLICVTRTNCPFLWNPSTGTVEMLPEIDHADLEPQVISIGFGWEESRDEYNVFAHVEAFEDVEEGVFSTTARVYSSKTNSWKKLPLDCVQPWMPTATLPWLCGKFHWDYYSHNLADDKKHIVTFDLKSEKLGRIEKPRDVIVELGVPDVVDPFVKLGVVGGCLCILKHSWSSGHEAVDVWVMKEYGMTESWVKLTAVSHVLDLLQHPLSAPASYLVRPNGDIVLFSPSDFVFYSPRENVFWRPLKIFCTTCLYVESFVSPKIG